MREYVVENEFVKAVRKAGGVAYKLTSQTANGLPDRLVLFFPAKTIFVELKAPGKQLRPLQRKRRYQWMKLGFPVLCIDRFSQIQPCIEAILNWTPGEPFPEGIGAKIPELEMAQLPDHQKDMDDYPHQRNSQWILLWGHIAAATHCDAHSVRVPRKCRDAQSRPLFRTAQSGRSPQIQRRCLP